MDTRHEAIGVKQTIRFEWIQKATNLLLAGLDAKTIRQELHGYLSNRKSSGSEGKRSDQTRTFAVDNLMKIWVSPDPELVPFRDSLLVFLREHPSMSLAIHWGMISAVYPFWFNVAQQTGRLLALQNRITQAQIISRLKEQYGDRQTVSRCERFVIRSFVLWGALNDSENKGCYEKAASTSMVSPDLAILMFESTLHATRESKAALSQLLNNPAFFPFQLPMITSNVVSRCSDRIEVIHYGPDNTLLKLK